MKSKQHDLTRLEAILAEWDLDDTDSLSTNSITLSANSAQTTMASPYVISGVGTDYSTNWNNSISSRISLHDQNADIEVNGWSLVDAVQRIEERLGLFQPNPELEKEWEDLRALAEQYRALEQHIKDKQATWERLKKTG